MRSLELKLLTALNFKLPWRRYPQDRRAGESWEGLEAKPETPRGMAQTEGGTLVDAPVLPNVSLSNCFFTVCPSGQARVLGLLTKASQLEMPILACQILLGTLDFQPYF